jgi:hypothetical protein
MKAGQVEKRHAKKMRRGVQCARTEIRKWKYRKCAGCKIGHRAK